MDNGQDHSSSESEHDDEIDFGVSETSQQKGLAVTKKASGSAKTFAEESAALEGADVSCNFTLPDGTTKKGSFKAGDDITKMKVYAIEGTKFTYGGVALYLGTKMLFDPLSISDIKEFVHGSAVNEVTVKSVG